MLSFPTALDEMGSRIDELEKSIADLMEQVQVSCWLVQHRLQPTSC